MEELNNLQETIEVIEPVEVLENMEEIIEVDNSKNLAIGAVVITGLIAGGIGIKKLWDRHKTKKNTASTIKVVFEEDNNESIESNEE